VALNVKKSSGRLPKDFLVSEDKDIKRGYVVLHKVHHMEIRYVFVGGIVESLFLVT
jgi:hypothetical protein